MSALSDKKPVRQADGEWRYATEPSMLRRKTDWNYRGVGSYAITLVLADRSRDWLGRLVSAPVVSAPVVSAPERARANGRGDGLGLANGSGGVVARANERGAGSGLANGSGLAGSGLASGAGGVVARANGRGVGSGQAGLGSASGSGLAGSGLASGSGVAGSGLASGSGLVGSGLASGAGQAGSGLAARSGELARPFSPRAFIEPTALGEALTRLWRSLGEMWPGVEPRESQLMPEHFHAILRVTAPQRHPLGQIVGSFKAKATAAARELAKSGASVPPGVWAGDGLFAPGLHDAILWNLRRYRQERDYILANPDRLAAKRANPELFRVVRDLAVALPGLARPPCGHFMAIGNHFLLQRPLFQIQCSRRFFGYRRETPPGGAKPEIKRDAKGEPIVEFMSDEFVVRREAAFSAAADGRVLISPCVSDGERQIAREALAAGLPLITLQNKGFAKLQKPSGRFFDACAAGQLLMLAPAAWPYQPGHKPMTRFDATAMNRICQWLAGDDAAQINYHGMKVANVDALAREAIGL